jgi:hypothetical protein
MNEGQLSLHLTRNQTIANPATAATQRPNHSDTQASIQITNLFAHQTPPVCARFLALDAASALADLGRFLTSGFRIEKRNSGPLFVTIAEDRPRLNRLFPTLISAAKTCLSVSRGYGLALGQLLTCGLWASQQVNTLELFPGNHECQFAESSIRT